MFNGIAVACLLSAIGASAPSHDRTIVRLAGRNATIEILSTANGPRYSAKDASGKAICMNLTLAELRQAHPALSRQVDSAICADADAPALLAGSD